MAFYRFARMEAEGRTDLYIDGVIESQRPWWDEEGQIQCPENFRSGMLLAGDGPLTVHVNSPGGDLSAGIAIFEMLRQRKGRTRCEITFAASAATLIPCGCQESYISPAGAVMIHNPQMLVMGDEVELEKAARAYRAWKSAAVAAYQERIQRSEADIAQMMTEEVYFNAAAAVDLGLCDGILEKPGEATAMQYNRKAVMLAERRGLGRMAREEAPDEEEKERLALIQFAKTE